MAAENNKVPTDSNGVEAGATPNPSLIQVTEDITGKDLYGDWISVSKSRKNPKTRGTDSQPRGKEFVDKKGKLGKNKFALLISEDNQEPAKEFAITKAIEFAAGPSSIPKDVHKPFLARKKRPRKDTIIPLPKVKSDDFYKPIMAAANQAMHVDNHQLQANAKHNGTVPPMTKFAHANESVKCLQSNIKTTMNVEFVEPNRLRFTDEPEPPDLAQSNMNKDPTKSMQESAICPKKKNARVSHDC
ncbi:hypothetical protein SESBI_26296 [Sesbania bispinosa]|nr:hypothetical protein SESBI_26296 [Sesbania bispinosa]